MQAALHAIFMCDGVVNCEAHYKDTKGKGQHTMCPQYLA